MQLPASAARSKGPRHRLYTVRNFLLVLLVLLADTVTVSAAGDETYLHLRISDRSQLDELAELVSIDVVRGHEVRAYAVPSQLAELHRRGYQWQRLPHPGANPGVRMDLARRAAQGSWDAYPSYAGYVEMMEAFADRFPELCQLHELGDSTNTIRPHKLLAVKISDHPALAEDEPEVFLTSSMHGDETTGFVLLLHLIDELLSHYDQTTNEPYSRRLTELVDSMEIWINPLANPDGTYYAGDSTVNGARRGYVYPDGTLAPVDPNRNFPDPDSGDHPDGRSWWQETMAMMAFAEQHRFVISANLHGGIEVLNYPWDTWSRRHTDDLWLIRICRAYADQAQAIAAADPFYNQGYMRARNNGITNGWDWYAVAGSRQDYMTYWHGDREVTIEISQVKNPPAADLPTYWEYNRLALLGFIENALTGARGLVTDGDGHPLAATIGVAWHDCAEDQPWVSTDPERGDYHRMLDPGSYWLVVRAAGYLSDVAQVEVASGRAARANFTLDHDLGRLTSLRGAVRDRGSGLPIAGATVRMVFPRSEELVTTNTGTYWFSELAEGTVLIEVMAEAQSLRTGFQVRYPETSVDLLLDLPPSLAVIGPKPPIQYRPVR